MPGSEMACFDDDPAGRLRGVIDFALDQTRQALAKRHRRAESRDSSLLGVAGEIVEQMRRSAAIPVCRKQAEAV